MSITTSVAVDTIKKPSMPISNKTVITVDDEGDGDYTSIQVAVYNANEGDIIQVYSGNYSPTELRNRKGITINGIPHELGSGNDVGKPLINGDNNRDRLIDLYDTNECIVDGFELRGGHHGFFLYDSMNNTVTNNSIFSCHYGIEIHGSDYNNIVNNSVKSGYIGIEIEHGDHNIIKINFIEKYSTGINTYNGNNNIITENQINSISNRGIELNGESNTVQNNYVTGCGFSGIMLAGTISCIVTNNTVTENEQGISLWGSYKDIITRNDITKNKKSGISLTDSLCAIIEKNNFIENHPNAKFELTFLLIFLVRWRNHWDNNFWDDSNNFFKIISGKRVIYILIIYPPSTLEIPLPWINLDRNPAKEPYNIEGLI